VFYSVDICKNEKVIDIVKEKSENPKIKVKLKDNKFNGISTFPNYCCKFYKGV
jgi:hypothetical protein